MKYMLMIHQGTTPTPLDPDAWATLSADEQQAIYAAYKAINETPGVTPGDGLQLPETATTVRVEGRQDDHHRRSVRRDQGVAQRLPDLRGRRPRRRHRAGRADPGGPPRWRDRGAADHGVVAILEQTFRDEWGSVLAALIGFLGDFDLAEEATQEAFAIAAERWPRDGIPDQPPRLAGDDRPQPSHRPQSAAIRRWSAKTRLLRVQDEATDAMDATDIPRRATRARLHVLPSGARRRRAGRAHVAHARRADHRRDRPRLPRARGDDGAATGAGQAQDQGRRHPVPGAARAPAGRSARRGARRRLPDLQRGLRRARRPVGRGAVARAARWSS